MLTNDDLRPVTLEALHRALRNRGWHPLGPPGSVTQRWQFLTSRVESDIIFVLLSDDWDHWPLRCFEIMQAIIAHDPALRDLTERTLLKELLEP